MPLFGRDKARLVTAEEALPGRSTPMRVPEQHAVTGHRIVPPFPDGLSTAVFGMGCFWGAERIFWRTPGVYSTAVGYAGGHTPHPSYEEVCSGRTGHTEVVLVVFDPARLSYAALLRVFWEGHDPTQGMRQGNDRGTQYRSAVYTTDADQAAEAQATRSTYQRALTASGRGQITSEIAPLREFYYAEDYHQQYLERNKNGYCGIGGTGVACPVGTGVESGNA
jgi:peptide-methionine (S)-S-oxide reductase